MNAARNTTHWHGKYPPFPPLFKPGASLCLIVPITPPLRGSRGGGAGAGGGGGGGGAVGGGGG
ncbi:MAG: hypothetical protein OXU61_04045, partial [Gammaproteobacteria bacterium]|nr:hypothetical protein [Gammaproteobacteria bacterium]